MKKFFAYLRYVIRHRWFVFVECCRYGIPWRGLVHDMSKFLPSEFFPYMEAFYGEFGYKFSDKNYTDDMILYCNCMHRKVMNFFDYAWLMHQKRNPHHWQFWMLTQDSDPDKILEMPDVYIKEMVADWKGAGRAITGRNDLNDWYDRNRNKMRLNNRTRERVEYLMEYGKLL